MRVITDSVVKQDKSEVAGEAPDRAEPRIEEVEHTSDGDLTPDGASCDDTETLGANGVEARAAKRRIKRPAINGPRALVFGMLPILALLLASTAAFLKWQDSWTRASALAGIESVAAAKESTVAILSYQPQTVDKDLEAARDRLTGAFKDSYSQLIHDVVIPGAKKQHISAIATVAAAASVSAIPHHGVALLFVNQTVTVGNDSPTETASAVRVTLDKRGGRWLISGFDPV